MSFRFKHIFFASLLIAVISGVSPSEACPRRSLYQQAFGITEMQSASLNPADYVVIRHQAMMKYEAPPSSKLDFPSLTTSRYFMMDHCTTPEMMKTEARLAFERRPLSPASTVGDTVYYQPKEVIIEWYSTILRRDAEEYISVAFEELERLSQTKLVKPRLQARGFNLLSEYNKISVEVLPLDENGPAEATFDLQVTVNTSAGPKKIDLPKIPVFDVIDPTDRNRPSKLQPLLACGAKHFLESVLDSYSCSMSDETCGWIESTMENPDIRIQRKLDIAIQLPSSEVPADFHDPMGGTHIPINLWHDQNDCPPEFQDAR